MLPKSHYYVKFEKFSEGAAKRSVPTFPDTTPSPYLSYNNNKK